MGFWLKMIIYFAVYLGTQRALLSWAYFSDSLWHILNTDLGILCLRCFKAVCKLTVNIISNVQMGQLD